MMKYNIRLINVQHSKFYISNNINVILLFKNLESIDFIGKLLINFGISEDFIDITTKNIPF